MEYKENMAGQNKISNVLVSVICLTYNHEKFIDKTLEGFVNQRTSFKFEVIVHDDASTDNTASIIKKYELKYPDIIKAVYQVENQYQKNKAIFKDILYPLTNGKYLTWCEGDDYWTDYNKLEKQVTIMENNPECCACFCETMIVDLDGKPINRTIPGLKKESGVINGDDFIKFCLFPSKNRALPIHISSLMMLKDIYTKYIDDLPPYVRFFRVGDIPRYLFIGINGDVYYINSVMSAYRIGNTNSYVGKIHHDKKAMMENCNCECNAFKAFDEYTSYKYHESVINGINYRHFFVYSKLHDIKGMQKPEMAMFYNTLSKQRKITHWLYYYFPHTSELLKKMRNRLRQST